MVGDEAKARRQPANPQSSKSLFMDDLTCEEEVGGIMKLAEATLAEFLNSEPDIYAPKDLKIDYKHLAASARGGDALILER